MDTLEAAFAGRKARRIGWEREKHSAVLIPLIHTDDGVRILFEVRSSKLPQQPGDICFPGGMQEAGEMPEEAAIRETAEELLVRPEQIQLIGPGDTLVNSSLLVHSFVGWLDSYEKSMNQEEVEETFTVPLDFFLTTEPDIYEMEWKPDPGEKFPYDKILGGRNYAWRERKETVLFYYWQDRVIWGMTAKILHSFVKLIKQ